MTEPLLAENAHPATTPTDRTTNGRTIGATRLPIPQQATPVDAVVPATAEAADRAASGFADDVARWRQLRGLTKKQLAARMGFDPSYVSHVEHGRHRPTEDFARRAETVLNANGAIWRRWQEYDQIRRDTSETVSAANTPPARWVPSGTGLIISAERASLTYDDGRFMVRVERELYNASTEPISRFLMRVAVDRYPDDAAKSNAYHREFPLSFAGLNLRARCGGEPGETMRWQVKQDRDAFKEAWLLFENEHGRFPLYPGCHTLLEYSYSVHESQWGRWFQRSVRLPTRRLTVCLDLPADQDPQVWGLESSLSADERPLRTPIAEQRVGDRIRYTWSTEEPPLHARYRLAWRPRAATTPSSTATPPNTAAPFAAPHPPGVTHQSGTAIAPADADITAGADGSVGAGVGRAARRPSRLMAAAGVVQYDPTAGKADPLCRLARRFELPEQADVAAATIAQLRGTLDRVETLHPFNKGVAIAAPQVGQPWAAVLIRPAGQAAAPVVLLNPRIVYSSAADDEQYEGCLSFFDVRGLVRRPREIEVRHDLPNGESMSSHFQDAVARLVAHEIDHLEGRLYVDRMVTGVPLVPLADYSGSDRPWQYDR